VIRELVEDARRRAGVPGCAVVVVQAGEVLVCDGFGLRDLDAELPVTPRTLFPIGSATKTFTAALALESGLDLDAPVRTHLPGFAMQDPRASARLSLRDCLTHRSGLPRHDLLWQAGEGVITREELVAALAHLPARRRFREAYEYNNLLYAVAAEVEGPFEQSLQSRLLGPLGMRRTNTSVAATQRDPDHARPYLGGDLPKEIPFASLDLVAAAGGLNTCAEDLAAWLVALTTRWPELRTPQVAMPAKQPAGPFTPLGYGLGLMVERYRGHVVAHHGGNIDGFSAQVLLRDDVGIAVLTNLQTTWLRDALPFHLLDLLDGVPPQDHDRLFQARLATVLEQVEAARPTVPPEASPGPPRPLSSYEGTFRHPGYGEVVVEARDTALAWGYRGLREGRLLHVDRDRFAARAWLFGAECSLPATFVDDTLLLQVEPTLDPLPFVR
jgi:CubicO group peptidase (beta-lactamase class C family)